MGQAKRRGTFEQRKEAAIRLEQDRLNAIEDKKIQRYRQEYQAYETMVWWQHDMTEKRHNYFQRKRLKGLSELSMLMSLFGVYGQRRLK